MWPEIGALGALILFISMVTVVIVRRQQRAVVTRVQELLDNRQNDAAFALLQNEVNHLREQLSRDLSEGLRTSRESIHETHKAVGERLDRASSVIQQVHEQLGGLRESSRRILEIGQDMNKLHDILRAPKLRGNLSEYFLADLLGQLLPPNCYGLQHRFRSGAVVDAVVTLGERMVPVDAKFPLENFQRLVALEGEADAGTKEARSAKREFVRDVKKHVDAIADKYIVPDEGTYDFALMYIPAENVYYEVILKDEHLAEEKGINQYALERRVIPVSPNSFYAYLQAILLGLRGLHIEERAELIIADLGRLREDFNRFGEEFRVLGKHLGNANGSYDRAERCVEKFGDQLEALTTPTAGRELSGDERPSVPGGGIGGRKHPHRQQDRQQQKQEHGGVTRAF